MAHAGSTTLEVVRLANGHYTVLAIGAIDPDVGAGEFETAAEAENWMFAETQSAELRGDSLGVLIPGAGQRLG